MTLEIRTLQRQAQQVMLGYAVEIGRRLEEVKAMLPHGQWGEYLKNEVDYSQSTANNFMRIYREYGAVQQSLFGGETKSQTFANLTYTKALRLLALPNEEEREQFMAEHDVEGMSNRELEKALKERDEALKRANTLEKKCEKAVAIMERVNDKAASLDNELKTARIAAQNAEEEHIRLLRELEELRSRPAEADTEAVEQARQAAIEEMTEKVNNAREAMNNAREARKKAEDRRKAAEESLTAVQKELDELKAREPQIRELTDDERQTLTYAAVAKARAEDVGRIQALEKQLAQADPDTAAFKVLFTSWQETYMKMLEVLDRIRAEDSDKAEKLHDAVNAAAERMMKS